MVETAEFDTARFGRTLVTVAVGKTFDQPVQGLICAANSRGLLGANSVSAPRLLLGAEVEREAMADAPYELGTAFSTTSGQLQERGLEIVIHAVMTRSLGETAQMPMIRRALRAALLEADSAAVRRLALPIFGLSPQLTSAERDETIEAIVDEIVSYLRRATTRLELIVLTAEMIDDAVATMAIIRKFREHSWISRV